MTMREFPRFEEEEAMAHRVAAAAIAAALLAAGAAAQQSTETFSGGRAGPEVYRTYCATCHGVSARGDGPLAAHLRFVPPDLTLLAKRNGGKFDEAEVYRIIDGRKPVKGHGGPDMPVWGDAFRRSADGYSEEAVKARIEGLVTHLRSLQRE
jgi:mono/diheme cytochrome c family protein